jgi:hypothetical protein
VAGHGRLSAGASFVIARRISSRRRPGRHPACTDVRGGYLREEDDIRTDRGAKFKVLKENIEHHIEEEEGEMFRLARGISSRDELRELAGRMLAVRG